MPSFERAPAAPFAAESPSCKGRTTGTMPELSIIEWSALAQIVLIFLTAIGITASLYMSTRALREVHTDRLLRQKPHPAFEGGGWNLPVEFVVVGRRIPGVNPAYVEHTFSDLPDNAESVHLRNVENADGSIDRIMFGRLTNFGLGPALETRVVWVPHRISIGSESFDLDDLKRAEPRYDRDLNSMPTEPQHVPPGGQAKLGRLPTFIDKDFEKKISEVEGLLEIQCEDVFGNQHTVRQGFWMQTDYEASPPAVHITFGNVLPQGADVAT